MRINKVEMILIRWLIPFYSKCTHKRVPSIFDLTVLTNIHCNHLHPRKTHQKWGGINAVSFAHKTHIHTHRSIHTGSDGITIAKTGTTWKSQADFMFDTIK